MGMFDTFIDKVSSVADSAKSWASSVIDTGSTYYEEAASYVAQKSDSAQESIIEKYNEAQWAVYNLKNEQAVVDAMISIMPEGAEKESVVKKRDEARGIFDQYVAPLINEVINRYDSFDAVDFNTDSKYSNFAGLGASEIGRFGGSFGLLPVAAVAVGTGVVAASMALIYWCNKAYELESAIANDPSLTAFQKAALVSQTGIQGALKSATVPLLIAGAIAGFYFLRGRKK